MGPRNFIQKELTAIFTSISKSFDKTRQYTLEIIDGHEKAPYDLVINYFFEPAFSPEKSKDLWFFLNEYREHLCTLYGDRVSLHIAAYYLTRDEDAVQKGKLPHDIKSKMVPSKLAILELKGWWERDDQTGLYRKEVMEQRFEQEIYCAKSENTNVALCFIKIGSFDPKIKDLIATWFMDILRCRDIVGHYSDRVFIIILPNTNLEGTQGALRRICIAFQEKFQKPLLIGASVFPYHGENANDLIMLAEESLLKSNESSIYIFSKPITTTYKYFIYYIKRPLRSFLKRPIFLFIFFIIIVGLVSLSWKLLKKPSKTQWVIQEEQRFNPQKSFPKWTWKRKQEAWDTLKFHHGLSYYDERILFKSKTGSILKVPLQISNAYRIKGRVLLSSDGQFEIRINANNESSSALTLLLSSQKLQIFRQGKLTSSHSLFLHPLKEHPFTFILTDTFIIFDSEVLRTQITQSQDLSFSKNLALFLSSKRGHTILEKFSASGTAQYRDKALEAKPFKVQPFLKDIQLIKKYNSILNKPQITHPLTQQNKSELRFLLKHWNLSPSSSFEKVLSTMQKTPQKEMLNFLKPFMRINHQNPMAMLVIAKSIPQSDKEYLYQMSRNMVQVWSKWKNFNEVFKFEIMSIIIEHYLFENKKEEALYLLKKLSLQKQSLPLSKWALNMMEKIDS